MYSDETFLPIVEDNFDMNTPTWWSDFCFSFSSVEQIENEVIKYNGELIRNVNEFWIGIDFKTKKDKLFFQLKFEK